VSGAGDGDGSDCPFDQVSSIQNQIALCVPVSLDTLNGADSAFVKTYSNDRLLNGDTISVSVSDWDSESGWIFNTSRPDGEYMMAAYLASDISCSRLAAVSSAATYFSFNLSVTTPSGYTMTNIIEFPLNSGVRTTTVSGLLTSHQGSVAQGTLSFVDSVTSETFTVLAYLVFNPNTGVTNPSTYTVYYVVQDANSNFRTAASTGPIPYTLQIQTPAVWESIEVSLGIPIMSLFGTTRLSITVTDANGATNIDAILGSATEGSALLTASVVANPNWFLSVPSSGVCPISGLVTVTNTDASGNILAVNGTISGTCLTSMVVLTLAGTEAVLLTPLSIAKGTYSL